MGGQLGVMYTSTGLSFINQYTLITPNVQFTNRNFHVTSASLTTTISLIESVQISYTSFLSTSVDVKMAPTTTLTYGSIAASSLIVQLQTSSNTHSNSMRRLLTDVDELVPGETLHICVQYSNMPANEPVDLFIALSAVADATSESVSIDIDIDQHRFVADSSGSGEIVVDWVVPWDAAFAGIHMHTQSFRNQYIQTPIQYKIHTWSLIHTILSYGCIYNVILILTYDSQDINTHMPANTLILVYIYI